MNSATPAAPALLRLSQTCSAIIRIAKMTTRRTTRLTGGLPPARAPRMIGHGAAGSLGLASDTGHQSFHQEDVQRRGKERQVQRVEGHW